MKYLFVVTLLVSSFATAEIRPTDVVEGYVQLAYRNYSDALVGAEELQQSIKLLLRAPSASRLVAAKDSWLAARPAYQQSEVFRFGNAVVDDWQGGLNSWPIDEGLIDYVASDAYEYELGNAGAVANIVANTQIGELNLKRLTPAVLASLNEFGGSEANVATGYHAIEFLLWGQDLNGYQPGAGNRPWTDYAKGSACIHDHCKRRGQYLQAAADLLVEDLHFMVAQWAPDGDNVRAELLNADPIDAMNRMLFGMGSLALGELAGERIKVALMANSTEDEHDCFSDNTHNSHYYNALGIANLYYGRYTDRQGRQSRVVGLRDYLLVYGQTDLVDEADLAFARTEATLAEVVRQAEQGMTFDRLIAPGNKAGQALLGDAISDLISETNSIEQIARVLGIDQLTPDDAGHSF